MATSPPFMSSVPRPITQSPSAAGEAERPIRDRVDVTVKHQRRPMESLRRPALHQRIDVASARLNFVQTDFKSLPPQKVGKEEATFLLLPGFAFDFHEIQRVLANGLGII